MTDTGTDEVSFLVVGTGGVGLLYGARLADAGHSVQWWGRSDTEPICRQGVSVHTEGRTIELAGSEDLVVDSVDRVRPADVVIVATKATGNADILALLPHITSPDATVAVFQNGLGFEERIADAVPQAGAVVAGLCFVCSHRVGPGRADHLDYGGVTLAPLTDTPAAVTATKRLETALSDAGFPTTRVETLGEARWRKLVWNIPFNGLSVLLHATTEDLLGAASIRRLVLALMTEVVDAARACGHPVPASFADEMITATETMHPYAPSMRLDHDAGRTMEVEAIYGVPCETARRAGAPMTRVEVVRDLLLGLEDLASRRQ